jgi:hypothetical protein
MEILKGVAFEEVLRAYLHENEGLHIIHGARDRLQERAHNRWSLVLLSQADILDILLPEHRHGTVPLVSEEWLTHHRTVRFYRRCGPEGLGRLWA